MSFERQEQAEKVLTPAVALENSFGKASTAEIKAAFHSASSTAEAHLPSIHLAMADTPDPKAPPYPGGNGGRNGAPRDRPPITRPNPMPQPRPVPYLRI